MHCDSLKKLEVWYIFIWPFTTSSNFELLQWIFLLLKVKDVEHRLLLSAFCLLLTKGIDDSLQHLCCTWAAQLTREGYCGSQEIRVRGTGLPHYIFYQTCKLEFEFCFEFCTLTHCAIGNSVFLDLWFKPTWSCEDAARLLLTLSTVWAGRSLWGANGPFWLFSAPWSQSEHLSCVGGGKVCNVRWQFKLPKLISVEERRNGGLIRHVAYIKLKSLFSWHLPGALPQCRRVVSTSLPHKMWWQAFNWKNWELFWCCNNEGHLLSISSDGLKG